MGEAGWSRLDGIVFDLGVSSMQLDEAGRGFSFMRDGPLDMRMSREGASAADIVNSATEAELADMIRRFGEERRSRAIAAAIVKARELAPITRTAELAEVAARVLGRHGEAKHPATRTFQALRMVVNAELAELEAGLAAAERALAAGGRLAVVSFHSLEDRMVKRFLVERSGRQPAASRHLPPGEQLEPPAFLVPKWHGVAPSAAEIAANPRSHSARLRWAIRI
jgi:16S rRNA (cytosine1402-N4)-methyltransferase